MKFGETVTNGCVATAQSSTWVQDGACITIKAPEVHLHGFGPMAGARIEFSVRKDAARALMESLQKAFAE